MKGVFDPRLLMVSRVHSPLPLPHSFPVLDVLVALRQDRIARRYGIFPRWNHHFRADSQRGFVRFESVVAAIGCDPIDVPANCVKQIRRGRSICHFGFRQVGRQDVPSVVHGQMELSPACFLAARSMLRSRPLSLTEDLQPRRVQDHME